MCSFWEEFTRLHNVCEAELQIGKIVGFGSAMRSNKIYSLCFIEGTFTLKGLAKTCLFLNY